MSNFFIDKDKIRTIDTFRLYYIVLFVLSFLLTELGRYVYRPYIYQNKVDDWGLADSVGNWGGIIVQIFFGLAVINPNMKKGIRLISFFAIGYMVYEFIQPILPKGVFDWQDVFGTLIGSVIGLLLFFSIHLLCKNKVIKKI